MRGGLLISVVTLKTQRWRSRGHAQGVSRIQLGHHVRYRGGHETGEADWSHGKRPWNVTQESGMNS